MNKLSIFQKIAMLFFALTIFILPVFFHYSIHITDALTLETATDFDVHISFWRILFEPIIGLMLFFNRSFYAIEENEYVLYWVLIFFVVYSLYKIFTTSDKKEKKIFFISQLVNLPVVIGLWFTYFIVLLFMSRFFPSNTIVNNSSDSVLVTTHAHTVFSHDGLVSQEGLLKWHKDNNFDAFFITDHNNHSKTLDFVNAQRRGEFPVEPLVMCGEEFSGTNHLSLLGLKRKFNTKKYSDAQVIDSVRANGGVVLVNHWFDGEKKPLQFFKDLKVDGFEIENSATERSYDRSAYARIKSFCESNNLIMNGGLDYHGYGNVCSIWNAMKIPGWHKLDPVEKEEAILDVIRTRDQSKLKVLLYTDRPYYTPDYLFFRPIITFFYYFRTLNVFQVLSWVFWILVIIFIGKSNTHILKDKLSANKIIPLLGISGAIFMLTLGGVYDAKISELVGTTNDIFAEYSTILFYVGSVYLLYSSIVAFFRFKNKNR